MSLTKGRCRNITRLQDDQRVLSAFSKLVSGKSNYKTIILKDKPPLRCKKCEKQLNGEEKFCPECGIKLKD